MSIAAWPFLVSRNRTIDYTTVVAPQFINEAHAAWILARAAGGEIQDPPDRARYLQVDGSEVGKLTLVFRIVQAEQQDIGRPGTDPLRDQSGRPIRLIEGIVLRGHVPESDIVITRGDLQKVHEYIKDIYREFWESIDASFPVDSDQLFTLHGGAKIGDDQQVRLIKEPSFRPPPKPNIRKPPDVVPSPPPKIPLIEPKRRLALALGCIVAVVLIGGSYFFPEAATTIFPPLTNLYPPSHTIKIAVDLPMSGVSASSGRPIADGVQFAIDQANSMQILPGYTIQYVSYDDRSDPETGKTNVIKAIDDGLTAAIIGPYNSSVALQEIPVTNSVPIAQISPANTNPCLTKDTVQSGCTGKNDLQPTLRPRKDQVTYFRLPATDDIQVKALVTFLRAKSYQTAYVVYNGEDLYSNFLAQLFIPAWRNVGGIFIGQDNAPGNQTAADYAAQFQVIPPNTMPDVVFFAGTMPAAANVKAAMAQVPQFSQAAFAGGAGIMLDSFVQAAQGGGPVFAAVSVEDTPTTQQFKTNYFSSGYSSNDYGPYTVSANDSAVIVIQAIKSVLAQGISPPRGSWDRQGATTFRKAIIHAIATISRDSVTGNLSLATGFQSFDQNGDSTNNYVSIYSLSGTTWQLQESDQIHR